MKPVFYEYYESTVRPNLMQKSNYKNIYSVPKIEKIVLNMGLGRKAQEKVVLESALEGLSSITGQKPCITRAKQSISGFKIREGVPLGIKATLRGRYMYEFLHRLVVIAMPRIRDFRGVSSRSFDGRGNFAVGIKEHYIFPEIKYDKITDILGMDVAIITTAKTDREAKLLLEEFGFPFYN